MSFRLRTPLPPEFDESLAGLIARNAAEFHFREPRRLLHRIDPPGNQVLWTLCETDPKGRFGTDLRHLLGIDDPERFRTLSAWTGEPTTTAILGYPIWRELLALERRAACPLCLQDKIYHRAIWFVRALPVCAVHGVWLHTKCHACEKPFSWNNSAHHLCAKSPACCADVRDAPVRHARAGDLLGIRALHALAHRGSNSPAPHGLGFAEGLKLSFLLGQLAYGYEKAPRPPGFIQRELELIPALMTSGWQALDDWPHGFHRLLDKLRQRAGERKGRAGMQKTFGVLAARVYQWAREPWGKQIGEEFANYAASLEDLATTAHNLRRYAPGAEIRHRFITTTEAQRALGVSASTIFTIAHRRGLFSLPPQKAGVPSLIRADTFQQLATEFEDYIGPDEARRMLGVGRKVADQLEDAGLITRLSASQIILESRPFRLSVLKTLVEACCTGGKQMRKVDADAQRLCSIVSATAPGRTVADIVRALVDGRLKATAMIMDARGLMKVRLRLADVERVLPSTKETLSLLDAAKQLGVKWNSVHHWVQCGLVPVTTSVGIDERGLRITRQDWLDFLAAYATSKMLAHEIGQGSSHWISRHLGFLGVEPVSSEDVDGGVTTLLRRADLTPNILAKLKQIGERKSGKAKLGKGKSGKGKPGIAQDKHRASFARVKSVGDALAAEWGATFTRTHNLFFDTETGRAVQIISGRRPDLTGVHAFHVQQAALARLARQRDPWVALVPDDGSEFLLMPPCQVPWRGEVSDRTTTRYVSLRFDGQGRAVDMRNWAQPMPADNGVEGKDEAGPHGRRSFDTVVSAAAQVEKHWGVGLERNRNAFVAPATGRRLHVTCGRSCGGPTNQIFSIYSESFARLSPDDAVALVPNGGSAFLLAPVSALRWASEGKRSRTCIAAFDARGVPLDAPDGAAVLPLKSSEGNHV